MRRLLRFLVVSILVLTLLVGVLVLVVKGYGISSEGRVRSEIEAEVGSLEAASRPPETTALEASAGRRAGDAALALELTDDERDLASRLTRELDLSAWTEADASSAEALLESRDEALRALRVAAADGPRLGLARGGPPLEPEELFPFVRAARLLSLDARQALREGDTARFVESAAALDGLARALLLEPPLIALLVGEAAEQALLDLLRDALAADEVDAATSERLAALLDGPDLDASLRRTILAEAVSATRTGPAAAPAPGAPANPFSKWWLVRDLGRAEMLDVHRVLLELSDRPLPELTAPGPPIDPGVWTPWGGALRGIWIPNWLETMRRVRGTAAMRAVGRLALDLHQARLAGDVLGEEEVARRVEAIDPATLEGLTVDFELVDGGDVRLALEPSTVALGSRDAAERPVTWTVP